MKTMFKCCLVIFTLFLGVYLSSCSDSSEPALELDKLSLVEVEEIRLVLDNETTSNNSYYQLLETDSMTLLAFMNPLNSKIYIYNLNERSLIDTINYQKEGPDGIGTSVNSFNIINKDSVFLHSYYQRRMLITDWSGKLNGEIKLHNKDFDIYPITGKGTDLAIFHEWVYVYSGRPCLVQSGRDNTSIVRVNTNNGVIEEVLDFPENYLVKDKAYWPRKLCNVYSVLDKDNQRILYSFPLDPKIQVVSPDGSMQEFDMGIPGFNRQSGLPPAKYPEGPLEEFKSFLAYEHFDKVYYDPYKKLYLRTFFRSVAKEKLKQNELKSEKLMIVTDDQFEVLGKIYIVGTENLLFGKKGIYQILYDNNMEDSLRIKSFKYDF